jgi:hypothetical protein
MSTVRTGSAETEIEIGKFLSNVDGGLPRTSFDDYMFKVMTVGRNQKGDHYEGSMAFDDTGGFFEVRADKLVYLTDKAKHCIR